MVIIKIATNIACPLLIFNFQFTIFNFTPNHQRRSGVPSEVAASRIAEGEFETGLGWVPESEGYHEAQGSFSPSQGGCLKVPLKVGLFKGYFEFYLNALDLAIGNFLKNTFSRTWGRDRHLRIS